MQMYQFTYLEKLGKINPQPLVRVFPLFVQRRSSQADGGLVNAQAALENSVQQVLQGQRLSVEAQL